MILFWLAVMVLFLIVEAVSAALCSVWFAVGALLSLCVAALGCPLWGQGLAFVLVSGVCLAVLYPRLKHLARRCYQPTNADMVIGQTCPVTERIDNLAATGTVSIAGKTWTARTTDGAVIEAGATVRIDSISGVKVFVTQV